MNAASMDEKDVLKKYKEEFYLPVYLYYEAIGLGPVSYTHLLTDMALRTVRRQASRGL